jgi:hypothetical protein
LAGKSNDENDGVASRVVQTPDAPFMNTRWTATVTIDLSGSTLEDALGQLRQVVKDLPRPVLYVTVQESPVAGRDL